MDLRSRPTKIGRQRRELSMPGNRLAFTLETKINELQAQNANLEQEHQSIHEYYEDLKRKVTIKKKLNHELRKEVKAYQRYAFSLEKMLLKGKKIKCETSPQKELRIPLKPKRKGEKSRSKGKVLMSSMEGLNRFCPSKLSEIGITYDYR